MIRIGVIGENENDTKAVSGLLKRNFPNQFYFHRLLPNINGSNLDDKNDNHLVRKLRTEFELEELDYVLYIRDLDTLIEDRIQVGFRKKRFRRFSKVVNRKAIFMLNIVEMEALICADFDTFRTFKNQTSLSFEKTIAYEIPNPSEALEKTLFYQKSELPTIIPLLNLETLKSNHKYFKAFLAEFLKMVEGKSYKDAPYYV